MFCSLLILFKIQPELTIIFYVPLINCTIICMWLIKQRLFINNMDNVYKYVMHYEHEQHSRKKFVLNYLLNIIYYTLAFILKV